MVDVQYLGVFAGVEAVFQRTGFTRHVTGHRVAVRNFVAMTSSRLIGKTIHLAIPVIGGKDSILPIEKDGRSGQAVEHRLYVGNVWNVSHETA